MYNLKLNLAFVKLFGINENKEILLSFLNAILENNIKLVDVIVLNTPDFIPVIFGKSTILDIKAVDDKGVWHNIEIQIAEQGYHGKVAIGYFELKEKVIQSSDLKKVIGIHILDFNYFEDNQYFRRIILKNYDDYKFYKKLNNKELYFIEMQKFTKEYSELNNMLDMWIAFLNKSYQFDKQNMPNELKENENIMKAFERLEKMSFTREERTVYQNEKMSRMDSLEEIRTAEEKRK
jgi:predicted transposase/invertase (TIGR01784 family)